MNAHDETMAGEGSIRIHSSTKTVSGKQYGQHCVRWYAKGVRKQRCFGKLADAERFRDGLVEEARKAREREEQRERVPSGFALVFGSAESQVLAGDDGTFALRKLGGKPRTVPLSRAVAAVADMQLDTDGCTLGDAVGMGRFYGAVAEAVRKLEGVERGGAK